MSNQQAFFFIALTLLGALLLVGLPPSLRLLVLVLGAYGYWWVLVAYGYGRAIRPHDDAFVKPVLAYNARWQGLVCLVLSAILFSPYTALPYRVWWAVFFAMVGIWRIKACINPQWLSSTVAPWAMTGVPIRGQVIRWRGVVLALLLWVFATLQGLRPALDLPVGISHHVQHGAWVSGFVAMLWATGHLWRHTLPRSSAMIGQQTLRYGVWVLILWVALAVRVIAVDNLLRVPVDETIFMTGAVYFESHDTVRLFHPMGFIDSVPRLYSYWVHLTTFIGGHNWFGLRLASIYIGMLTLPALYVLAKTLFNRRVALWALALGAVFAPHVHFSRLAMIQIADVLAGTLAVFMLVRAVRSGRGRDFLLAGVLLGATQFFYDAGRLLYPLMLFLWLGRMMLMPMASRPAMQGHVIRFIGAFVVTALPAYLGFWVAGYSVTNRAEVMVYPAEYWAQVVRDAGALLAYGQRLLESIGRYVAIGEIPLNILQYDGQHPLIFEPLLPFFLLGVGVLVWRWRSPVACLLALWLGGTAFGSSLLLNHASDSRYVVAFPALVLVLALGADAFVSGLGWAWQRGRGLTPSWRVYGAVMLVCGAVPMAYYFGDLLPNLNAQILGYNYDGIDAMIRTAELPDEAVIITITDPRIDPGYRKQEMAYFSRSRPLFTYNTGAWQQLFADVPRQRPIAFFIAHDDTRTLNDLRAWFALDAPQFSPYTHLPERYRLVLWVAPAGIMSTP